MDRCPKDEPTGIKFSLQKKLFPFLRKNGKTFGGGIHLSGHWRVNHFVPLDTLKLLYYSLFYSFVSYGLAVWGLTYETLINTVFIIQKKIIKAVNFSDMTAHSDPIFSKLGLLKVGDIFQLQLLSFMYDWNSTLLF